MSKEFIESSPDSTSVKNDIGMIADIFDYFSRERDIPYDSAARLTSAYVRTLNREGEE